MKIAGFLARGLIKAIVVFAWLLSAPAWAAGGYVYDAVGDVSVAMGKDVAHPVLKNDPISSDTVVNTGDKSYAVLKFEDGQVATMQANSSLHVREYLYDPKRVEKNNIFFSKFKGGMRFITGLIGQRNHKAFRLSTPNATIGIRGTEFLVVRVNGSLYSRVISGSISMTNGAGMAVFKAGQNILVKTARTLPEAIPAAALPPGIFDQLDAIPALPSAAASVPEAGAAAMESAALTATLSTVALLASSPGAVPLPSGAVPLPSGSVPLPSGSVPLASGAVPLSSDVVSLPSITAPTVATKPVPAPSATTVSITGEGATYTGADLLCDFCTGRSRTVATHVDSNSAAGGPVTGDASLFGKHNLTPAGANTGEICAFCHTPQGAEDRISSPRWNRTLTTLSSYRAYSSLGSATQQATGSVSMSCLSCHDGGQAPNIVINTPNLHLDVGNTQVDIGIVLKNHHPVGVQYAGGGQNQNAPEIRTNPRASYDRLADMNKFADGNKFSGIFADPSKGRHLFNSRDADAMADVLTFSNEGDFDSLKGGFNKSTYSGTGSGTVWWVKSPNSKKGRQKTDLYLFTRTDVIDSLPGESELNRPYVECATCHDPHSTNPTFLRIPGGNARSQICLTCHNK